MSKASTNDDDALALSEEGSIKSLSSSRNNEEHGIISIVNEKKKHKKKKEEEEYTEVGFEAQCMMLHEEIPKEQRKTQKASEEEIYSNISSKVKSKHPACVSQQESEADALAPESGSQREFEGNSRPSKRKKRRREQLEEVGSKTDEIKLEQVEEVGCKREKRKREQLDEVGSKMESINQEELDEVGRKRQNINEEELDEIGSKRENINEEELYEIGSRRKKRKRAQPDEVGIKWENLNLEEVDRVGSKRKKGKRAQPDEVGSTEFVKSFDTSIRTALSLEVRPSKRKEKHTGHRQTSANFLADKVVGSTVDEESPKEEEEENEKSSGGKKKRKVRFGRVSILGGEREKTSNGEVQEPTAPSDELDKPLFSCERAATWREDYEREGLVWAKRFTKEEDELLKKSIFDYIKSKGWAEAEGLAKIWNSYNSKEERGCWKEISNCLPHRAIKSIVSRAHRLLDEGAHKGKWSQEEEDSLRRLHTQFGHNWRRICSVIGRSSKNVKDKWRLMKVERAKGQWTQQELLKLCNMVHENLRLKAKFGKEKNPKDHRVFRDEINWQLISDKLGSRTHSACASEWYHTLASSMVSQGQWATEDDQPFLLRLLESGADDEEAVEWHKLLQHRSGLTCRKRWKHMVRHLGESSHISFGDKLKLLTQRYAPDLLEDQNQTVLEAQTEIACKTN
ncbi:hypothetical protein O6H91_08G060400 [Diphasiastrum complanatum]|uniref:Uncharacterized protein n=1 Tax=Diphasiastrum complanatum TaxID=34168 RepID=A0ACC2CY37_DIPCM|nr:hypothetical protein O6H91_08G060400 [Diphasiastrum complanatum]